MLLMKTGCFFFGKWGRRWALAERGNWTVWGKLNKNTYEVLTLYVLFIFGSRDRVRL